ncbi:MAG: response regulator transcription factor [Bacteroidales bacterium]|jgi:DNA-binding response OmpR family regulator|nr:response regulator transcription factor [Bacteroidales bacterium]
MKILVIEDNRELLDLIAETLRKEKYVCELADRFSLAEEKVHLYSYDILVVDINLPDGSGLDIIRAIKKINPHAGVIVISARDSLDNKIEGLELGADDYITKPFDMAELVVRVKSLLRRRYYSGSDIITQGDITLNTSTREVKVGATLVELTRSEYDILLFFFSNPGRVISKESLAEHIWGDHMDLADSFDFIYSHIKNLRKKFTVAGASDPIKAVYGMGYKLEIN